MIGGLWKISLHYELILHYGNHCRESPKWRIDTNGHYLSSLAQLRMNLIKHHNLPWAEFIGICRNENAEEGGGGGGGQCCPEIALLGFEEKKFVPEKELRCKIVHSPNIVAQCHHHRWRILKEKNHVFRKNHFTPKILPINSTWTHQTDCSVHRHVWCVQARTQKQQLMFFRSFPFSNETHAYFLRWFWHKVVILYFPYHYFSFY